MTKSFAVFVPFVARRVVAVTRPLRPAVVPGTVDAVPASAPENAPRRLAFVDGVRGLLSLLIVLHHLRDFVATPAVIEWLTWGRYRVTFFMVLSGFVLYLPSAGNDSVCPPRSLGALARLRLRRLMPAWCASLLLCAGMGALLARTGYVSPFSLTPQNAWDVLTHLTLTHSVTRYSGSINGPGHTLGTEWQLFVLMTPFLWLAARRGWLALIALVLVCALLFPSPLASVVYKVFHRDFTLPFVLGLAAARLARLAPERLWYSRATLRPVIFGLLVAGMTANVWLVVRAPNAVMASRWAAAVPQAAFLILMAWRPGNALERLFAHPLFTTLGRVSFSLYLTHFPLLALAAWYADRLGLSDMAAFHGVFLPALPLIVVFAHGFSWLFERPFRRGWPVFWQTGARTMVGAAAGVDKLRPRPYTPNSAANT